MSDDMFDHIEDMDLEKIKKALEAREWFIKEGMKWQKKILGENSDVSRNTRVGSEKLVKSAEPTRAVEKQRLTDSKPSAIWVKDLKLWGVKDE